jgi:hypothetical protein
MQQGVLLLLVVVGLVVIIKMVSKTTKRRLDKKIPAPLWARHVWHLVPEPLLNELTKWDWEGIKESQVHKSHMYCSQEEMDSFSHPIVLSLTTSPVRIQYIPIVLNCLDLSRV